MLACRLDGALTKIRGYREALEFSWFAGQSCYFGRRSRRRLRSGVGRTGSDVPEPHQAGRGIATLNLGGIVNQFDTPLKLNGNTDNGSNLNLEGNGLKKNLSSFEAGGAWRFLSRHRIDVQYFSAKRSGTQTYNNEITIRDNVYPIGATVSVEAKDNFLLADYRYSFVKTDEVEFAGLLGFNGGQFKFNVSATGNDLLHDTGTLNTSTSTTVPLPLIGASVDWYINPRWKVSAGVEGIKANIGDVDGRAIVAAASTEYIFTRNLGAGVRYMYSDLSVDVTKSSFDGHVTWRMNKLQPVRKDDVLTGAISRTRGRATRKQR